MFGLLVICLCLYWLGLVGYVVWCVLFIWLLCCLIVLGVVCGWACVLGLWWWELLDWFNSVVYILICMIFYFSWVDVIGCLFCILFADCAIVLGFGCLYCFACLVLGVLFWWFLFWFLLLLRLFWLCLFCLCFGVVFVVGFHFDDVLGVLGVCVFVMILVVLVVVLCWVVVGWCLGLV